MNPLQINVLWFWPYLNGHIVNDILTIRRRVWEAGGRGRAGLVQGTEGRTGGTLPRQLRRANRLETSGPFVLLRVEDDIYTPHLCAIISSCAVQSTHFKPVSRSKVHTSDSKLGLITALSFFPIECLIEKFSSTVLHVSVQLSKLWLHHNRYNS